MKIRKMAANLLLSFALISLGFGLGKEAALRQTGTVAIEPVETGGQVVVYYLRSSFRCVDCNRIETLTDELIRTEFADELADGRLDWQTVDYMRNPALAARYNVSGNMLMVARFEDGEETHSIRLDRVMERVGDREAFLDYVRGGIVEALRGERR